jgi:TatA/E family protein of Tat protein translocase
MMNIGAGEILLLAVLALLIFGPKRLPEIGKQVAKGLREFRRATNDLKSELKSGLDEESTNSNSNSSRGKAAREATNSETNEDKEPRPGPRG